MTDYEEYYKSFYSRYSQRELRKEKNKNNKLIKCIKSKMKECRLDSRSMISSHGAAILRQHLDSFRRELKECEIKKKVLDEMIKPQVINWKVCVALCFVGFTLYKGVKAEMKSPVNDNKDKKITTSMYRTEEESQSLDLYHNQTDSGDSLEDILRELVGDWQKQIEENHDRFTNPTEPIR